MENEEIERIAEACGITKGLPPLTREKIAMQLEKAVEDGKLEPKILGFFNTHPVEALAWVPEDIAKSYGLPVLTPKRPLSREDVAERIQKAVADGKLEPTLMGAFITNPSLTLSRIPEDIAKSYGIPRPSSPPPPAIP